MDPDMTYSLAGETGQHCPDTAEEWITASKNTPVSDQITLSVTDWWLQRRGPGPAVGEGRPARRGVPDVPGLRCGVRRRRHETQRPAVGEGDVDGDRPEVVGAPGRVEVAGG